MLCLAPPTHKSVPAVLPLPGPPSLGGPAPGAGIPGRHPEGPFLGRLFSCLLPVVRGEAPGGLGRRSVPESWPRPARATVLGWVGVLQPGAGVLTPESSGGCVIVVVACVSGRADGRRELAVLFPGCPPPAGTGVSAVNYMCPGAPALILRVRQQRGRRVPPVNEGGIGFVPPRGSGVGVAARSLWVRGQGSIACSGRPLTPTPRGMRLLIVDGLLVQVHLGPPAPPAPPLTPW